VFQAVVIMIFIIRIPLNSAMLGSCVFFYLSKLSLLIRTTGISLDETQTHTIAGLGLYLSFCSSSVQCLFEPGWQSMTKVKFFTLLQ